MKSKLFFATILAACLFMACSGNANANKNTAADAIAATAASTSSSSKGIITCTIDGKPKTFQVHNSFFEIRLEAGVEQGKQGLNDGFELLDGSATNEGFQFEIKNKGTSVFKGMDGVLNMFSYFNSNGADYVAYEDVTETITSFDGTHLTGIFSGKFQNTNYKGDSDPNPEFIQITDGKFNLNK